tara:strand:+ start:11284 stop:13431 length:2148 start_codon:yes stop_codon:yes gene_type:complete
MNKITLLLFVFLSFSGNSQKNLSETVFRSINWGNYYYSNQTYEKAIDQWKKTYNKLSPETLLLLSKAYAKMGQKDSAQFHLSQIIDSRYVEVEDYYFYASLLPEDAVLAKEYRDKASLLPLEKRKPKEQEQNTEDSLLINLKRNTPLSEFGANIVPQGDQLTFYFLTPQKEEWSKKMRRRVISSSEVYNLHRGKLTPSFEIDEEVILPTNLNSIFQEGPIAVDTVQKIIFLSRSSGKIDNNNKVQVDLYSYNYAKPNQIPTPMPINMDGYSSLHPAVDYQNNRLIFSSDRPKGIGGMDLYYIPLDQANVSIEPVNIGTDINTDNNETFPFVASDGTLFYTNEAKNRNGDFDINMAIKGPEDRWKTFLLPVPYNSKKDDFSFALLLEEGLGSLSSNRPGGKGNDDLYVFYFKPQMKALKEDYTFSLNDTLVVPFEGVLTNDLELMYDQDPLTLLVEKQAVLIDQPKNGRVKLNKNGSFLYKATTSEPVLDSFAYQVQSDFSTSKKAWVRLNPIEEPFPEAIMETFRPIYYDLDKVNLKEFYLDRAEELVEVMNQYPEMEVEMISSTDCFGSASYNLKLSERRTQTILNYVRPHISNPERLRGKGIGESTIPNNDNKNYTLFAGHFRNLSNATRKQKKLLDQGLPTTLKIKRDSIYALVVQNYDYVYAARKAKATLTKQGFDTAITPCDCYQETKKVHQEQRKTIFNIIAIGRNELK